MKKLLPLLGTGITCSCSLHQSRRVLGGLMMTMLAANAQVTLNFDDGLYGITAGADATSVVWDSMGKRLEINTTGNFKAQCAKINFNDPDPSMVALKNELVLALANGGTLSYDIIVETTSVTGGAPGYFESIYVGNSQGIYDQTFGALTDQITVYGAFPLSTPINHTVNYTIENSTSAASDTIAQINSSSSYLEFFVGLNSTPGTTIKYYIDNITVTGNLAPVALVIPTVTIAPTKPGLTLISSGTGLFDRKMIRTVNAVDSWVGKATPLNPVSMRFSTTELPEIATQGSFIYIIPVGNQDPFPEYSDPDYNAPTCARLIFARVANGQPGGIAEFAYKVNLPDSNGPPSKTYFDNDEIPSSGFGGRLATINTTSVIGDWTIKFTSNTEFSITGPDGTTASGTMLQATADLFSGPLHIYFGNVPGSEQAQGLVSRYNSASITGLTTTPIVDNFILPFADGPGVFRPTPLNPSGVIIPTATQKYWLNWSLPATGFTLEQSPDLGTSGPWTPVTLNAPTTINAARKSIFYLLDSSEVTSTTRNFFRLTKPATVPAP